MCPPPKKGTIVTRHNPLPCQNADGTVSFYVRHPHSFPLVCSAKERCSKHVFISILMIRLCHSINVDKNKKTTKVKN